MGNPPASPCQKLAASYRDPGGRLFSIEDRIFRLVGRACADDLNAFLASKTAERSFPSGRIVGTRTLTEDETRKLLETAEVKQLYDETRGEIILEHDRVSFPNFPYEWPPEMLHAAGALTLELAASLLPEGLGLKDATPYNVLFQGPEPVFIDILSFEKRKAGDPVWLPYAQFSRTFLLPLLVSKYFGWSLDQLLTTRRDGLEPEEIYRAAGFFQKLLPPFLGLVTLPTWLAAGKGSDDASIYQQKSLDNPEKAKFILESMFKRLRRQLEKVAPVRRKSTWSDYEETSSHYSSKDFEAKNSFVKESLAQFSLRTVLDVGCNTGHFSALAARQGTSVVAVDQDPVVVGEVWRRARKEKLDILPLVGNFSRPTPATGWRNQECPSFLDRARGVFEGVVMLAVLHHILVNERVPLEEVLELAAEMTTKILVIEFVAPDDRMFKRIVRGREHLFTDLNKERFEAVCQRRFQIVRSQRLAETSRWLYLLRKNS